MKSANSIRNFEIASPLLGRQNYKFFKILLSWLGVFALLYGPAVTAQNASTPHSGQDHAECDRLAAAPEDPTNPPGTKGVLLEEIDVVAADTACRRAIGDGRNPRPRDVYQMGRVREKADPENGGAIRDYGYAMRRGHVAAITDYARLVEVGHGIEASDTQAYGLFTRAASLGHVPGMIGQAKMLERGRGTPRDPTAALTLLRKAAETGSFAGRLALANALNSGLDGEPDRATAMDLYRDAVEDGYLPAYARLGAMHQKDGEYEKALALYRQAADAGDGAATWRLCLAYLEGHGVPQSNEMARKHCQHAAKIGNVRSFYTLGWIHYKADEPRDAFQWFSMAAARGNASSMNMIGVLYANGAFGDNNAFYETLAVEWYRKAADAGYAVAMRNLGYKLRNGEGTQRDIREAYYWFRKAARAGDASSLFVLGVLHDPHFDQYTAPDLIKDAHLAAHWYGKAHEAGVASATDNIGWMIFEGRVFPKDREKGFAWRMRAAEAGNAVAMRAVGWYHEWGMGTEKDMDAAIRWYRKAHEAGEKSGTTNLQRLGVLSPAEPEPLEEGSYIVIPDDTPG